MNIHENGYVQYKKRVASQKPDYEFLSDVARKLNRPPDRLKLILLEQGIEVIKVSGFNMVKKGLKIKIVA
jgi:hypothetical protein